MLKLVIGNRNYSSWSLRAWLFLRESDIEFEVVRLSMFTGDWLEAVRGYSPAGRVPVLIDSEIRVWDSLAIIEYVRERYSTSVDWPARVEARAQARSIAAEMHSGFLAVRDELPQNIRARLKREESSLSAACRAQIARIDSIWSGCRQVHRANGSWLFGEFSIADVMFASVALRFMTYGIELSPAATEFVAAVRDSDAVREWCEAAAAEREKIEFVDRLMPADESPLTLG